MEKKNGNGVLYESNNDSRYIGEFLNGKKNGKGKEYYYNFNKYYYYDNETSYLTFEGDFLNNNRIKGKEYYKNGKIKFEGEYLFSKKWNGKIYDIFGNVIFEINNGNCLVEDEYDIIKIFMGKNLDENNCRENVKGKEYNYNGQLLFEGEFLRKEKWKGKINKYYKDELIFEGEYLDGKLWSGKGKEIDSEGNITFEGEYINGMKSGYLKKYNYYYRLIFEGEYLNDEKNGNAKEYNWKGELIF